jgi:hypothetical protein
MMWMPTRLKNGEGRAGREETNKHLSRSTGVVSTACREGDWVRGVPGLAEVASPNVVGRGHGQFGRRRGSEVPMRPGNPAEGEALTSGVLVKEERCGD